ncbi:MAG: TRAP transporter substrate-binding protein [Rhodovibrionaceae bacterium]
MTETKTSRRGFLGATAAAAGLAAAPSSARAQDTIQLTMVSAWPKNAPGVGVNAERFARRLEALSGGRIAVNFFAAGELVPPFEAFDAVAQGTADLAHATPYYWTGKAPALHYFTGVPFGLTATEFAAWLEFGGGQALWDEVTAPFGIRAFYAGSSGTQAGGWFNKEINELDDFKGLKFRIAGLGGEVLKRLGVATVLTPPGEIAPSLASGAVDGADWVGPWNDVAFGLHRFAKYYYMPGFHEPGPSLEILVNEETYAGLPEELQAAVREAARAGALETIADFAYHNIETFPRLAEEGVEVRRFSDEIVRELGRVSEEVLAEIAESDELTGRVHASYMAFLRKAVAYAPHAEQGILEMRAQVM